LVEESAKPGCEHVSAQAVLKTQHVNKVSYILLSTINVLLLCAWKIDQMLKDIRVRGLITCLAKRNIHT